MQLILGLGIAGFMIAIVFFTKLSSLPPHLQAAVIGVRTLLVLGSTTICLYIWRDREKHGRDIWGHYKIDNNTFIGKWNFKEPERYDFGIKASVLYESIVSFYPDSTFFSEYEGNTGKWWYSHKDGKLHLRYDGKNDIETMPVYSFDDLRIFFRYSSLTKLSSSPESFENRKKILTELLEKEDETREAQKATIKTVSKKEITIDDISGSWHLKVINDWGSTIDLGMYRLNQDGTGSCPCDYFRQEELPLKYKLDKQKRKINLSLPNEVMVLNIQEYDGEVMTGIQPEEPRTKYIFTKGI